MKKRLGKSQKKFYSKKKRGPELSKGKTELLLGQA